MAGSSRKRAIDLTADDDDVPFTGSQQAGRKNPRLADVPVDDEYDEGSLDEVIDPSQSYDRAFIQFTLYAFPESILVRHRIARDCGEGRKATITDDSKYDRNAIQVQNVQGDQIGHIPRQMAAKLASYMDNGHLIIEGVITGHKGQFDCPIALKLYGTSDPVERLHLTERMKADRLPLDELKRAEKAERDRLKALQAAKKKGNARAGKSDRQWQTGDGQYAAGSLQTEDVQSLDDILGESERFNPRNVEQMVEKFGTQESDLANLPMAEQPEAISAKLLPYQLQGLKWLLDHENPQLPHAGSADVVQLWRRSPNQAGVFTNICTNYSIKDKLPQLASGGILADDMGLGKTVQIISLIMADRARNTRQDVSCNATLILSPLSVMSNWSSQIKRHVKSEHELRVLTYHGTRKRLIDPKEIQNYDVVITTYETVMTEYWPKKTKTPQSVPRKNGLFSVNWRRIVLDEGHNIRNPASKKAVAAVNLLAQSRWILTGTPIINTLKDLYSLVKFLRLSGGLDRFELFNGALIRPVNQGDEHGSFLLQTLMASICLRRRKDMAFIDLRLPELSEYVHRISFLPYEQEKYEALEAEAKGTLDKYRQNQSSGADAAKTYRHLLEILLRLRQVCNHWKLCGEERISSLMELLSEQKTVDLTPKNREALQSLLQLSIDSQEDCPICLEPVHDPVITSCAHVFGYTCIERVIEGQRKCPMCRAELITTAALVRPRVEEAPAPPPIDTDTNSSKIEALLKILKATATKDSSIKTVVFSQWTSFLDILVPQLNSNGIFFTRIDGSMPALARDAALDKLESDPDCTVLLASLSVCSVGLNLVAASQVVLADSWWAPAIEDQAVDRVHRLGQKRETTVFRLVVENTVEDSVLKIQDDKRKLMRLAFWEKGEGKKKKGRESRLADLERLLG